MSQRILNSPRHKEILFASKKTLSNINEGLPKLLDNRQSQKRAILKPKSNKTLASTKNQTRSPGAFKNGSSIKLPTHLQKHIPQVEAQRSEYLTYEFEPFQERYLSRLQKMFEKESHYICRTEGRGTLTTEQREETINTQCKSPTMKIRKIVSIHSPPKLNFESINHHKSNSTAQRGYLQIEKQQTQTTSSTTPKRTIMMRMLEEGTIDRWDISRESAKLPDFDQQ